MRTFLTIKQNILKALSPCNDRVEVDLNHKIMVASLTELQAFCFEMVDHLVMIRLIHCHCRKNSPHLQSRIQHHVCIMDIFPFINTIFINII